MLTKNQDISLYIDGMSAQGCGIGHYEGMAVFVQNSAVGDTLLVHIIKVKKTYAIGKILQVITPSPDRTESDCPVSARCGGCCYRHISYEAELRIKQQRVSDAFKRIGHLDICPYPIIGAQNTEAYRNKAQFPVGFDKDLQIGFYAINSHRIIPCKECKLQPEIFSDILGIIENWISKHNVKTYNESSGSGLLRHIYIRRGHYSGEIMVCLIINGEQIPYEEELIEELKSAIPEFETFVLNINQSKTNVIMGPECKTLYGKGYITDRLLGCTFRISPLSFYQVNSAQAEVLYKTAAEFAELTPSDVLLDLYCGTGTIGLTMADRVSKLIGVEIIPQAVEDAKKNATENNCTNAEFFCGDASALSQKLQHEGITPDVILVDPPRKGLDEKLISTISEMSPRRVVYISCDPETLARDCARFSAQGYLIRRAVPVDMFPRTSHVETVVLLERNI